MILKTAPTFADDGHSFTATFAAATPEKNPGAGVLQLTGDKPQIVPSESLNESHIVPCHTPEPTMWDQFLEKVQAAIQGYNSRSVQSKRQ